MGRRCELTGKGAMSGHRVAHSGAKSRRVQRPNLQKRRVWMANRGVFVRLVVSTRVLRTLDVGGAPWPKPTEKG